MTFLNTTTQTGRLRPALEPERKQAGMQISGGEYVFPGEGTASESSALLAPRVSAWNTRWRHWRDGFEQQIGPNVRRFWQLYRAFEEGGLSGVQNSWRDRTVIPTCFRIIETRVPRIVMAMFGQREWFHVEGGDPNDEMYEEMIRELIRNAYELIGRDDHRNGDFIKRMIDSIRYREIMGHVFYKQWWRQEYDWINTKVKDENGKWQPIQSLEETYNNVDIAWLSLDRVAMDLSGGNRWHIERVDTTYEAMKREHDNYKRQHGEDLYPNLNELSQMNQAIQEDSYEEPRDTEYWPLTEEQSSYDPGEQRVELWLCWDSENRTLTKIANRRLEMDHGLAPTPNGRSPIFGAPSVPVPNRVYGESYLHWVGPLATMQTRLARGRMDEILLNMFQQYMFRQGTIANTDMFWQPGGSIAIEGDMSPDRPISDHVMIFPRKPVMPDNAAEDRYREKQAEDAANADPLMAGQEATSKSRDVAATEVNQRTLHGQTRDQVELLYNTSTTLKPLLIETFELLKQNLTKARSLRVLGEKMEVDLESLEAGTDIIVGAGLHEISRAEIEADLQEFIGLSQSNEELAARINPEGFWKWWFKMKGRRGMMREIIRSDEEVQNARAQIGEEAGGPVGAGGGGGSPPALPSPGGAGGPIGAPPPGGNVGSAGPGPSGGSPGVEYI